MSDATWTDPDRHGGDECFAGTRVPVARLWEWVEAGETVDDFLEAFPSVRLAQVEAVARQADEAWGAEAVRLVKLSRHKRWVMRHWALTPDEAAAALATPDAIEALSGATSVLERHLKPDRIPAAVRRRAPALGDRSLLQLALEGRHQEVTAGIAAMFDLRRVQP